ncbi:MAG: NAD(P)-dependent oxidoreductase [Rhodobacteraceae bacterium]|nr:NAD(P)-dependent oxidoreductase [Paracoccaceae bacterium]
MLRVGLAGLGNVGAPLARNLLAGGLPVTGLARSAKPELEALGLERARSVAELADRSDVIVTALPGAEALDTLVTVLSRHPGRARILADMSSYDLAAKADNARRLAGAGVTHLDCEISGLPPMIRRREAVIFKSGDAGAVAELAPVFDAMTCHHFMLGDFGAATKMKLIANLMVCVHNLMAAEALNLGERAGLRKEDMIAVLEGSAASSSTFRFKAPLMARRDFDAGIGPFEHMFGYLDRVERLAEGVGARSALLQAARGLYGQAEAEGRHAQDIAAILEIVEAQNRRPQ